MSTDKGKGRFIFIIPDYSPMIRDVILFYCLSIMMVFSFFVVSQLMPHYNMSTFVMYRAFAYINWLTLILFIITGLTNLFGVIAKKKDWLLFYSDLERKKDGVE